MKQYLCTPRRQQGATLIITLVMLVLITLVSVSTIRTSTMDEKMAGGARDRDKALQAAEAAVQLCLKKVEGNTVLPALQLVPKTATNPPWWEPAANWASASGVSEEVVLSTTGTAADAGLAQWPRCMYELLGAAGSYRVTGRAVGGASSTEVILQATYSVE